MAKRVRATFAGIEFSGFDRGTGTVSVTVPTNVFNKILLSNNVKAVCTEDQSNPANFGKEVDCRVLAVDLLEFGKPTLLYLDTKLNQIRYCVHRNLCYNIIPK